MSRAKKVDTYQKKILAELKYLDICSVVHVPVDSFGGFPDIVIGYEGKNYLFEIKTKGGKLTPKQESFFKNWNGQVNVCYNVGDILKLITEFKIINCKQLNIIYGTREEYDSIYNTQFFASYFYFYDKTIENLFDGSFNKIPLQNDELFIHVLDNGDLRNVLLLHTLLEIPTRFYVNKKHQEEYDKYSDYYTDIDITMFENKGELSSILFKEKKNVQQ